MQTPAVPVPSQMAFSGFGGDTDAGDDFSTTMQQADSLGQTRALFIAAAGNGPTALSSSLPASLGLSNLIAVTDSDQGDVVTGNTGAWVDVAVPSGSSSQATGIGAGLAALMVAAAPQLTPEQIEAAFVGGVVAAGGAQGKVASNGVLDAGRAFEHLRGQGLVRAAAGQPDEAQLCDMARVWSPAWPAARLPCGPSAYDSSACWQSYAAQF